MAADNGDMIPSTLARSGAARFWLAVLLTGIGTGIAAVVLTRLLEMVQHLMWGGPGTNLLDATEHASAWRHVLVLLGAGLVTGAGQIILKRLSSGNGIDTTAAIWFHGGRMPAWRTLGSALLSVVIVGMGVSLGREGAPKQAGAVMANFFSDRARLSDEHQTEFAVDQEQYIVRVPNELEPVGVLMEPLSVVEKAIDEALRVQMVRCPDAAATPDWFHGRRCLVAGLGPVGLLAAMVLRLRGGEVYGLDVVDANTARPKWLGGIGGTYIDGREVPADQVEKKIGAMDLVLDASGIAELEFNLLDALALNGVYVLTGIPGGDRPFQIPGAELVRQLVLDNQVMLGSVNAAHGHFQMAADDLAQAHLRWGTLIAGLITNRYPWDQFAGLINQHQPEAIKQVIEWA
jgi:threonine dehydrogenase-like Zn-dependent dehydrogenase